MSRVWTGPLKRVLGAAGYVVRRHGAKLIIHSRELTPTNVANFAAAHHLGRSVGATATLSPAIDLVVDVGANRGQFGDELRGEGYRGRVLSFEPQAALAAQLASRVRDDPSWRVRAEALGAATATAVLHQRAADDLASFAQPSVEGLHHFGERMEETGNESVTVRRLDSLIGEEPWLADAQSIFLKVDTQGHDLAVLEGSGVLLTRVALLQLEAAVIPLYTGVDALPAMLERVSEMGFTLSGFFPIGFERTSGAILEADVRFVRRQAVPA